MVNKKRFGFKNDIPVCICVLIIMNFSNSSIMKTFKIILLQREHLKIAQQYFQLVGGSASECGKYMYSLRTHPFSACSHLHIHCT